MGGPPTAASAKRTARRQNGGNRIGRAEARPAANVIASVRRSRAVAPQIGLVSENVCCKGFPQSASLQEKRLP